MSLSKSVTDLSPSHSLPLAKSLTNPPTVPPTKSQTLPLCHSLSYRPAQCRSTKLQTRVLCHSLSHSQIHPLCYSLSDTKPLSLTKSVPPTDLLDVTHCHSSLSHNLTQSVRHPLTYLSTYPASHSLFHPFDESLAESLSHSLTHQPFSWRISNINFVDVRRLVGVQLNTFAHFLEKERRIIEL